VLPEFVCEDPGQTDDAVLGRRVRRTTLVGRERQRRADVDDLAVALLHHHQRNAPAEEVGGVQVEFDAAPIVFVRVSLEVTELAHSGIVHENVDPAVCRQAVGDDAVHILRIGEIPLQKCDLASFGLDDLRYLGNIAGKMGNVEIGTCFGEGRSICHPQAHIRAGNDGNLAVQPEIVHGKAINFVVHYS